MTDLTVSSYATQMPTRHLSHAEYMEMRGAHDTIHARTMPGRIFLSGAHLLANADLLARAEEDGSGRTRPWITAGIIAKLLETSMANGARNETGEALADHAGRGGCLIRQLRAYADSRDPASALDALALEDVDRIPKEPFSIGMPQWNVLLQGTPAVWDHKGHFMATMSLAGGGATKKIIRANLPRLVEDMRMIAESRIARADGAFTP